MSLRLHLQLAFGFTALLSVASICAAQTGPEMFIRPWDGETINMTAAGSLYGNSHIRGSDDNFQFMTAESAGRWRILGDRKESPVGGYELHYLHNDTTNPAIPDHLVDMSISLGSPVAMVADDWFVIAIAGVGYAGNSWFADPDAVYGTGSIIVGKEYSKYKALIFGLDYNGNRTIFPDIPLPGFAYQDIFNDRIKYTLGVPFSLIQWTPIDELEITLRYALVSRIEASIDHHVTKKASLFLRLTDTKQAFHIDGTDPNTRIFFDRKAAELGVKWSFSDQMSVSLLGGYGFSQSYSSGFSLLHSSAITKPADKPYVRGDIEFRF